jgi:hypothetical protein
MGRGIVPAWMRNIDQDQAASENEASHPDYFLNGVTYPTG